MNTPLIYRRWQMPLPIKIFFWLFMALPLVGAILPMYDMLSRDPVDWAGVTVLSVMIVFCSFLYYLAIRYNIKISKNVIWLAEKMQVQAYVSRGMMPGFIFWPEVSGNFAGAFVMVKFVHYRRYRFTDLIVPKILVHEQSVAAIFAAQKTQKLSKGSELRQNDTAYIFRLRGCIVEKPIAEEVLLAFQILTHR